MRLPQTWEISFERLQTEAPVALDLLYFAAFLAPDDIDPKLVSPAFPDAMQFDQARAALRRYSLSMWAEGTLRSIAWCKPSRAIGWPGRGRSRNGLRRP
jgi:hypothetical protein